MGNISEDETTTEIGFELLPEHQSKGIMQEMLPAVIKYGFETINLRSIEGEVDPSNIKSIKLMEKNGFVFYKRLENTEIYFVQNPNIKR